MAMTKKAAEKAGIIPIKVELELYIDPKTGNIFYPCDDDNKLYDRYIYLTDPTRHKDRVVNILCKDHRAKWQRQSIGARALALVEAGAKIYIDNEWKKLNQKLLKKLQEKGLFPPNDEE